MPGINARKLIREARRRRVFRVAGLYIVAAWVVVQIALAIFPALSISDTAVRYVWIASLLGFPVAVFFGWRYDIRDGRIVRTGAGGADVPLALQRADFAVLAAIGIVTLMILSGAFREITSMEPPEPLWPSLDDIDSASVAVLPFVNMSADPNNEYFSDGLTETLLHMLAQLPDLKVSARTSAFSFKNKDVDIRTIALALGVAHVLEGSVQKSGDRVRVTAQLIRADDGFHVWSHNYDRTLDDVFAIQDEISGDVAIALGSTLLGDDNAGIRNVETMNFAAYDIYLRALEQQNINTLEALSKADELFRAALEKDPEFVDAKLGLARNYIWQYWKGSVFNSDPEEYRSAQTLVEEILAQRPDNLSAQVMDQLLRLYIGYSQSPNFGTDESLEAIVNEMVRLAEGGRIDSFLTARLVFQITGPFRGRNVEGLELLLTALETDPLNVDLLTTLSTFYWETDRPDEAKPPLLTALQVAPENPELYRSLGSLAFNQENVVEAQDWFRQAHVADPDDPAIVRTIARIFYLFGLLSEGDQWFDQVRAMAPGRADLIIDLEIEAAAAAQDQDRLLKVLEEAIEFTITAESYDFLSTVYYPSVMGAQGRSQEALDYLTELIPGLQDYSKLIGTSRYEQFLQGQSFLLQQDVMDQERYERLAEGFAEIAEAQYPWLADTTDPGEPRTIYKIMYRTWLGDHDQALELLLEGHADWPMLGEGWLLLQVYPWFERYRNDPELAVAIRQHEKKKARIADELREMVKRPEWRY